MVKGSSRFLLLIVLALSISTLTLFWLIPPDDPGQEPPSQAHLTPAKSVPLPLVIPPTAPVSWDEKAPNSMPPSVKPAPDPIPSISPENKLPTESTAPQPPVERVMEEPTMLEDLDAGYEGLGGLLKEVAPLESEEAFAEGEENLPERQD